jgi:hypothetical protein
MGGYSKIIAKSRGVPLERFKNIKGCYFSEVL